MKPSKSSFYLDFKELTCTRNLVIIGIFYILLLGIAQMDIIGIKKEIKEIEIANKLEKLKFEQFDRYKPYAAYGIRFFTMPSPLNFLSGFKIYGGLIANVDHGTKVNIYETRKGINIIPNPASYFLNFTGLLIIFGYLLTMLLGHEAFNDVKELRLPGPGMPMGDETFFGFYGLIEQMKRGFIEFFFEKEYFSAHVSGKVESFIKGDENIYRCRSSLPTNLWAGIILTLLYSTGLIALTHYFTYRKIFPVKQKLKNEEDVHTFIRQGAPNTWKTN